MRSTVSEGPSTKNRYGLGLGQVVTPCGTVWGHVGQVPGYSSEDYADSAGQRTVSVLTTTVFDLAGPKAGAAHRPWWTPRSAPYSANPSPPPRLDFPWVAQGRSGPDHGESEGAAVGGGVRDAVVRAAEEAQRVVAQFRAAHDLWGGDPAFLDLLERLRGQSPEFAVWWETHDISTSEAGEKILYHPAKGLLRFEYTTFQANDDPALRLSVYTPV